MARKEKRLLLDDIISSQIASPAADRGWCWVALTGIFIVQFSVPSVLSSYGIDLVAAIDRGVPLKDAVWNPVLFAAFWCITDPWSYSLTILASHRSLAFSGVLFVSVGLLVSSVASFLSLQRAAFGVLGGMGTSLVMTQADLLLKKYFSKKFHIARAVSNFGLGLGLLFMPLAVNRILDDYSLPSTLVLQTTIVLQAFVGVSLFRDPSATQRQSASQYTLLDDDDDDDDNNFGPKYSNMVAPSSGEAPKLPESTNVEKSNEDLDKIESYEEYKQKQQRRESARGFLDAGTAPKPLFDEFQSTSDAAQNDVVYSFEEENGENVLWVRKTVKMSSGQRWCSLLCSRLARMFKVTSVFRPFFLPVLVSTTTTRLSFLMFWTLTPAHCIQHGYELHDAALLLVVSGLATTCVSVIVSCLRSPSQNLRRGLYVGGCLVASVGFFLVSQSSPSRWLLEACVLIGFGAGAVHVVGEEMMQEDAGAFEFSNAQGLLKVTMGVLIVLLTTAFDVIQNLETGYNAYFRALAAAQLVSAFMWLVSPVVMKMCRRKT